MLWGTSASAKIPSENVALGANGYGSVYVFNCFDEPVTALSVGGYGAGDILASSSGGGGLPGRYTPGGGLQVPRSLRPGNQQQFAVGNNAVEIPWDSFLGFATITVPDPRTSQISLDDDLVLLLATNSAMLLTTRGSVVATFRVNVRQS
jgi:hypothetical protein